MDKMLLGFVLFSLFAVGTVSVYGEEIIDSTETQDTVTVPFDWNGRFCGWEDPELKIVWICSWDPNRINILDGMDNGTTSIPEPLQGSTTTCPERFTIQEDMVTCLPTVCDEGFHLDQYYYCIADSEPVAEITDKEVLTYRKLLEDYREDPPKTYDELQDMWQLENLDRCQQGILQARGIQNERSFVTTFWDEKPSVAKAGHASALEQAQEECNAQKTLLPMLGISREPGDVRSAQGWFMIPQLSGVDIAEDVPKWTQERVNQEANIGLPQNLDYCDAVQHLGLHTLRYMGCVDPTKPDPQAPVVIHESVVTTQNDAEDRWTQYKLDGGAVEADRIKAENLAKHEAAIYAKERLTNPDYSITREIYKIERDGWSLFPESERPSECFETMPSQLEYYQRCGQ